MSRKRPRSDDPSRGFLFDGSKLSRIPGDRDHAGSSRAKPRESSKSGPRKWFEKKHLSAAAMPRFEEVSDGPGALLRPVPLEGRSRGNWRALVAVGLGALTALGFAWFASRPTEAARGAATEFASPATQLRAPSGVESAAAESRFQLESAETLPDELESAAVAEPPVGLPPVARSPAVDGAPAAVEGAPAAVEGAPAAVEANSGTAKLTIEVFGPRRPPPPPPPPPAPPGSNF